MERANPKQTSQSSLLELQWFYLLLRNHKLQCNSDTYPHFVDALYYQFCSLQLSWANYTISISNTHPNGLLLIVAALCISPIMLQFYFSCMVNASSQITSFVGIYASIFPYPCNAQRHWTFRMSLSFVFRLMSRSRHCLPARREWRMWQRPTCL